VPAGRGNRRGSACPQRSPRGGRRKTGLPGRHVRGSTCLSPLRHGDRTVAADRHRRAGRYNRRRGMSCSADRRQRCISRLPRPAPHAQHLGHMFSGPIRNEGVRRTLRAFHRYPSWRPMVLAPGVWPRPPPFRPACRRIGADRPRVVGSCNRKRGTSDKIVRRLEYCTSRSPQRRRSDQKDYLTPATAAQRLLASVGARLAASSDSSAAARQPLLTAQESPAP